MSKQAKKVETEVTDIPDDEFELMFSKTADEELDAISASSTDDDTEAKKAEAKAAEEAEKAKAKEAEAPSEDEKTEEEKAAETAKAAEEAEKAKAKEAEKAKAAEEAKAKAAEEKKAADEKAAADKAAREAKQQMSDDEKALAAEVAKDFPDVNKIIEINNRISEAKYEAQLAALREEMMNQFTPVAQAVSTVAGDAFERAVLTEHPDAFDLVKDVEAWVDTQPTFLRKAYNEVLDNGTAAETIELFTTFKTAKGLMKTPEELAAEAAEAERLAAEQKAKEEKLKSMEGVRGRQAPKKELEPTTFEDGFERASKAV